VPVARETGHPLSLFALFAYEFGAEFLLGGQDKFVSVGEEVFVSVKDGDLRISLFPEWLPILTRQEALIVDRADLPIQCAGIPVLVGGFTHVPQARGGIFDAKQRAVVGPAQFVTQRVTIPKGLKEQAHISETRGIESSAKLGGQETTDRVSRRGRWGR
jgi:hypothetical protein